MKNTKNRPTILFDGTCNLCNASVKFVRSHDKKNQFEFSPLPIEKARLSSVVLVEEEKKYFRSTAALRIAKRLDWPMPLLYGFILVPRFVRDAVYSFIAARRHRWFAPHNR